MFIMISFFKPHVKSRYCNMHDLDIRASAQTVPPSFVLSRRHSPCTKEKALARYSC